MMNEKGLRLLAESQAQYATNSATLMSRQLDQAIANANAWQRDAEIWKARYMNERANRRRLQRVVLGADRLVAKLQKISVEQAKNLINEESERPEYKAEFDARIANRDKMHWKV